MNNKKTGTTYEFDTKLSLSVDYATKMSEDPNINENGLWTLLLKLLQGMIPKGK